MRSTSPVCRGPGHHSSEPQRPIKKSSHPWGSSRGPLHRYGLPGRLDGPQQGEIGRTSEFLKRGPSRRLGSGRPGGERGSLPQPCRTAPEAPRDSAAGSWVSTGGRFSCCRPAKLSARCDVPGHVPVLATVSRTGKADVLRIWGRQARRHFSLGPCLSV